MPVRADRGISNEVDESLQPQCSTSLEFTISKSKAKIIRLEHHIRLRGHCGLFIDEKDPVLKSMMHDQRQNLN